MRFTKNDLEDVYYRHVLSEEINEDGINQFMRYVFSFNGAYYECFYECNLVTGESFLLDNGQEVAGDDVECEQVYPESVTTTKWVKR